VPAFAAVERTPKHHQCHAANVTESTYTAGAANARTPSRDVPRARALVLQHGWNAMSYQVVNDGISHWFSAAGDAVVGFVRTHGVCVVAGAPICDGARLLDVLEEWEAYVRQQRCRVCYFGAAGRLFDALHQRDGYATVVLGAQPVWYPVHWPAIPAQSADLRRQMHRARNKGVRVSEWTAERAAAAPELRACLAQWLATRGLPTLHFLVEPQTLHELTGRRIFVAERGNTVVGFVNASPVPARQGWLVEQFVRTSTAPNGTIELLIDSTMRAVAADGARYVTLGLVPLREQDTFRPGVNPAWLTTVLTLARAHGRRFYNFRGLEHFKTKLRPHHWEPIYAISGEAQFSWRTLYAIAAAFTVQSPLRVAAGGLARAAQVEVKRLQTRLAR
jgi:phosphatidylglycerol lysyltransferase